MTDQTIYLLIGPPSIGKSTYIKSAFNPADTSIISRDDIVQETALSYGLTYDDLFTFPPSDTPVGVIVPGYENFGKTIETQGRFKSSYPVSFSNIADINNITEKKLYNEFDSAVSSGKNLVIDMTNVKKEGRKDFINRAKSQSENIKVVAVVFNFQDKDTLDVLKNVAEKRRIEDLKKGLKKTITPDIFARIISSYEPPSESEGFDEIKYVDTLPQLRKIANQTNENMKVRKLIRKMLNEYMEIGPTGNLIGWEDSELDLSKDEMDKEFLQLFDLYKVEDGRIVGHNMKEYWFPIEAKKSLELIGITWGKAEMATNKEHPEYRKRFWVVDYDNLTK
jgi:predicted kinase